MLLKSAQNPSGPVSQSITQIAEQIAAGNTGAVNQAIEQVAQQVATGGAGANIEQAIVQAAEQAAKPVDVTQQISQLATQVAEATGATPADIQQTLQQFATQFASAQAGGDVSQVYPTNCYSSNSKSKWACITINNSNC